MLTNPRSVVTGAGSGLGRAFSIELAKRGARIVVSDIDLAAAEETVALVREHGAEAVAARCDVRDFGQVEALARLCESRFGGVDLIVNNAGVAVGGELGKVSPIDWKWIVDINLLGVAYGIEAFVPRLRANRGGYVINVASAAGLISSAGLGPYNATKAAVVSLSETLAAELRGSGVNVTVLCPTFFPTNIFANARGAKDSKTVAFGEALMKRSPYDANDIARIALEHVERGELFCVPMADGRLLWRLKRALPSQMPALLAPGGGMKWINKVLKRA